MVLNALFFYAFFTARSSLSSPFLRPEKYASPHRFDRRTFMDFVFIAASVALWGLMVLLVWGFKKLEKPQGGRP
jgi:hypothetical protein